MKRALLALIVVAACGGSPAKPPAPVPVAPVPEEPVLATFDVFGSKTITRDVVLERWRPLVVEMMTAFAADDADTGMAKRDELVAAVQGAADLAFVELGVIGYFQPKATYATLDLVDADDAATRMVFSVAPTGQVDDPDGLLALWSEYEEKMWPVLRSGGGKTDEACPAWHCITFADPTLTPYRDAFEARVPAARDALARVLREDADEHDRGNAAFLLAHVDSADDVIALMVPAFRDPSAHVRNNAMRVLALMSHHHPEVDIPLAPVLEALRYPTTTDRNKAAAILDSLAKRPEHHAAIIAGAGDVLIDMLALAQPNNHDYAYLILKSISGQDLGERDVAAWRAWLASAAPTGSSR